MFGNLFSQKCVQCGKDFAGNANFCPYCGATAKGGKVECGNCHTTNDGTAKFCVKCGQDLAKSTAPSLVDNQWKRGTDDFATRLEVRELRGFLSKELIVAPGTRAMLISDGENLGMLDPGSYTLQTLVDRIPLLNRLLDSPKAITVILVDTGDVEVQFDLADLYTKDPLKIAVRCKVVVQLSQPVLFLTNLLKDQRAYPLRAVRGFLFDEVLDAAQEFIGKRSVDELARSLQLKREMEVEMEAHLNRTLESVGLRLAQVRTLDFKLERFDKVRNIHEEYFLQISEQDAKNQGRRRLFDVRKEDWLEDLREETSKTEIHEQRAAVWERMRRSVLSDRTSEAKSHEEWDVFLTEANKRKLLRTEELDHLRRDIGERGEDHQSIRAHIASLASVNRDFELRQAKLVANQAISRQELDFDIEQNRREKEGRYQIEYDGTLFGLKRDRALWEFEQEKIAKTREMERQQIDQEWERAMRGFRDFIWPNREKKMREEFDREEHALTLRLREAEAVLNNELARARQAHAQELARLQQFAQMSTESLIAVSGLEQGKLLAELKRTETLKGMSEEQILALAAEKSPQVAQAFIEKFRAMASPEQQKQLQEMYERMLKEQKDSAKSVQEIQEDNAKRLQAMFDRALESQRDTATAFAKDAQPPTIIITGSGASTTVTHPGTQSGQVQVCKKCRVQSPVGIKFCANCGEAFF